MKTRLESSLTICLLAAGLTSVTLSSCRESDPNEIGWSYSISIESEALNETRDIFVHMPRDYGLSETRSPVLYVLDAENVFGFAVGAVDFLSGAHRSERRGGETSDGSARI